MHEHLFNFAGLNPSARLAAIWIFAYSEPGSTVRLDYRRLGQVLGASGHSARRWIDALLDAGLIARRAGAAPDAEGLTVTLRTPRDVVFGRITPAAGQLELPFDAGRSLANGLRCDAQADQVPPRCDAADPPHLPIAPARAPARASVQTPDKSAETPSPADDCGPLATAAPPPAGRPSRADLRPKESKSKSDLTTNHQGRFNTRGTTLFDPSESEAKPLADAVDHLAGLADQLRRDRQVIANAIRRSVHNDPKLADKIVRWAADEAASRGRKSSARKSLCDLLALVSRGALPGGRPIRNRRAYLIGGLRRWAGEHGIDWEFKLAGSEADRWSIDWPR